MTWTSLPPLLLERPREPAFGVAGRRAQGHLGVWALAPAELPAPSSLSPRLRLALIIAIVLIVVIGLVALYLWGAGAQSPGRRDWHASEPPAARVQPLPATAALASPAGPAHLSLGGGARRCRRRQDPADQQLRRLAGPGQPVLPELHHRSLAAALFGQPGHRARGGGAALGR